MLNLFNSIKVYNKTLRNRMLETIKAKPKISLIDFDLESAKIISDVDLLQLKAELLKVTYDKTFNSMLAAIN